ncbi:MAG: hypothetical protein P9X26_00935 [Candidatus Stygibacter frigidus]|nr:hypothetical protein [Candidatus Stygibacter frigidus]
MKKKQQIVSFKIITHQELGSISTLRSYDRAEKLYRKGAVLSPVVFEDGVESIVYGSMKYKCRIEWDASTKEWDFSCTCPYDHGGICKHLIALGFWMIDNCKYSSVEIADKPTSEIDKLLEMADSSTIYNFLKEVITNDNVLLEKFKTIIINRERSADDVSIDELVKEYLELFTTLEVSDEEDAIDSFHWGRHDFYMEEWEMIMEVQSREIEEQLEGSIDEITGLLETGKLLQAVYNYFAFNEAFVCYLETDIDYDYEISELIVDFIHDHEKIINKLLTKQTFQIKTVDLILETFYERYLAADAERYLGIYEDTMLSLPYTENQAAKFLESIRAKSLTAADQLQLSLVQITKDKKMKFDICQDIYPKNIKAAKFLLNKFKKNPPEFHNFVKKIIPCFADELLPVVFPNLKKEIDPVLYRTAAEMLFQMTGEIKYYLFFKEASPDFQMDNYLKKLDHYNKREKAFDVLIEEKQYEQAFQFYLTYAQKSYYSERYLKKLINYLPQACLDHIIEVTSKQLISSGKRDIYHEAGRLLAVLLRLKDGTLKKKGRQHIDNLCQKYRNRPAMLDEFRSLKLI